MICMMGLSSRSCGAFIAVALMPRARPALSVPGGVGWAIFVYTHWTQLMRVDCLGCALYCCILYGWRVS